jgi:hypothetical protein
MSDEIPTNLFSPQTVEWMRISRNINNYVDEIFETLKKDNKLHLRETEDLYKLTSGPPTGWISNFASYVNAWIGFFWNSSSTSGNNFCRVVGCLLLCMDSLVL